MSATQIIYSLAYFGISFFFFQIQFLTGSAIINLDKIKSPLFKIQRGILKFMSIQTGTYAVHIFIPDGTASIASRIRINAGFQS